MNILQFEGICVHCKNIILFNWNSINWSNILNSNLYQVKS